MAKVMTDEQYFAHWDKQGQTGAKRAGTWFKGYTDRIRFRRLKKVSVRATNNDDEPGINYLTIEPIL